MELAKAIKHAARFCLKPDAKEISHACIRFVPSTSTGLNKPMLYVHHNGFGLRIAVDQEVPDALVPAHALAEMCKDVKAGVTIQDIQQKNYGHLEFTLVGSKIGTCKYAMKQGLSPKDWDGFEVGIPDTFELCPYWWMAKKALHAAHKEVPFLSTVRFHENYVESTDKSRYVRIEVPWGWSALLPVSLFRWIPDNQEVTCRYANKHAFFQMGDDEWRYHIDLREQYTDYPDCSGLLPEEHLGPHSIAPVKGLWNIVRRAVAESVTNWVTLGFSTDQLVVRSYQREKESKFEVAMAAQSTGPGSLLIDGKLVLEALDALDTPNARLCYGEPTDPLLIESGFHQECIWPLKT